MLLGCFIKLRMLSILGICTFKKDNKMKLILEFWLAISCVWKPLKEGEAFPEPLDSIILFIHELTHFKSFFHNLYFWNQLWFGGRGGYRVSSIWYNFKRTSKIFLSLFVFGIPHIVIYCLVLALQSCCRLIFKNTFM